MEAAADFDESKLTFKEFSSEAELEWMTATIRAELAEPYSRFTYNYFLTTFPRLTVLAYYGSDIIGCIIGKAEQQKAYIAMLVVLQPFRRHKIGKKLFDQFFERVRDNITKVELETQCINTAALRFYESLGFIRKRRMLNYYMSGNDAFRLKLYLPKKPQNSKNTDNIDKQEKAPKEVTAS